MALINETSPASW